MSLFRIKKRLVLQVGLATKVEEDLGIAVPSGQVIKIVSAQVMVSRINDGVMPNELFAICSAKPTNLGQYNTAELAVAPEVVGLTTLVDSAKTDPVVRGENWMSLSPDPFSLSLLVGIGADGAVPAGSGQLSALFVVDYEVVKLTSAIATSLAGR